MTSSDNLSLEDEFLVQLHDPIDGALQPFIEEYAKLQQALATSHGSEERIFHKCSEINKEIIALKEKKGEIDELMDERDKLFEGLAIQIAAAKTAKKDGHDRSLDLKQKAISSRSEVDLLVKQSITCSETLFEEQERVIGELEGKVAAKTEIRDRERSDLTQLRQQNIDLYAEVEQVEKSWRNEREEIGDLERRIHELTETCRQQELTKQGLDEEIGDLRCKCEEKAENLAVKRKLVDRAREELQKDKLAHKESAKSMKESTKRLETINDEAVELEDSFQRNRDDTDQIKLAVETLNEKLREEVEALDTAQKGHARKQALLEKLREKNRIEEELLQEATSEKCSWLLKAKTSKADVQSAKALVATQSRQIDVCIREREVLSQDYLAKSDEVATMATSLMIAENASSNMESELKVYNHAINQWKQVIEQLVCDTDANKDELQRRSLRKARAQERVAHKVEQITRMQKEISENQIRLRQQQTLLEQVRNDRNMYNKTLVDQREAMKEFKRVFEGLQHTISQLQEELNDKEGAFVTEHLRVEQVDEEIQTVQQKIRILHTRVEDAEKRTRSQVVQLTRLNKIIIDADGEYKAQIKQHNAVVNEQKMLSHQLIARNDELAKLYEELRLQESKLQMGEGQYEERRRAVMLLHKCKDGLQQELDSISYNMDETNHLQRKTSAIEQQLLRETLKVRALERELSKPMNVHRWRKLQDTDAEMYGMIQRIREMQHDLIDKSGQVKEKDALIQSNEMLYVDLRRVLARQPGSEAATQLRVMESAIKEKKAKHRALNAELKMFQAKVHELKYEIEKLYGELSLVKLSYFERKRGMNRHQEQNVNDEAVALSDYDAYKRELVNSSSYRSPDEAFYLDKEELGDEADYTTKGEIFKDNAVNQIKKPVRVPHGLDVNVEVE